MRRPSGREWRRDAHDPVGATALPAVPTRARAIRVADHVRAPLRDGLRRRHGLPVPHVARREVPAALDHAAVESGDVGVHFAVAVPLAVGRTVSGQRNSRRDPPFDARHYSDWRGPEGRRACRWCGVEVPKGRKAWCSDVCVTAYCDTFWPTLRRRVLERDRGVCVICRTDVVALVRRLREIGARLLMERFKSAHFYFSHWHIVREAAMAELGETRAWPRSINRDWWEADHIVPVCEGGTDTLDNLRLLCVPCHKAETATLAGRLARARRERKLAERREQWERTA